MTHVPHQARTSATTPTTPTYSYVPTWQQEMDPVQRNEIQIHQCAHNALSRAIFELRSEETNYELAAQYALAALSAMHQLSTSGRA